MAGIRPYRKSDLSALYAICLATGDAGRDASHLYRDPDLIGHVYAGGYAACAPETTFMVEDYEGRITNRPSSEGINVAGLWSSIRLASSCMMSLARRALECRGL